MDTLAALLSGIVAEPLEETRWLVLADYLEEFDDPRRAELLRLHRRLIATCCEPDAHPERRAWQARMVELLVAGVRPCVPQHTITLPGGVALTGSFIPPGSFLMGGTIRDDEKPVREVTLARGFFMGIHPVTQAQWKAVMGTEPSHFKGPNRPVESVSYFQSQAFCAKLTESPNGRATVWLPAEGEWEYACRAGTTTHYHFGDVINTDLANFDANEPGKTSRGQTTAVGSFPASGWGLYDMHGNVWQWCQYGDSSNSTAAKITRLPMSTQMTRVHRGGSWNRGSEWCRAACRNRPNVGYPQNTDGFRVCFVPE